MLRSLLIAVGAAALLSACASTDIVSKSPGQIALVANNSHEMDNARRRAQRYCDQTGLDAQLQRTEAIDKGAVAYFTCM